MCQLYPVSCSSGLAHCEVTCGLSNRAGTLISSTSWERQNRLSDFKLMMTLILSHHIKWCHDGYLNLNVRFGKAVLCFQTIRCQGHCGTGCHSCCGWQPSNLGHIIPSYRSLNRGHSQETLHAAPRNSSGIWVVMCLWRLHKTKSKSQSTSFYTHRR